MDVHPMICLKTPIDVPSMTNAIHTNDMCLVVQSIENSVVPLSQSVTILSDEPLGSSEAWIGCKVVDGIADPCLHCGW